MAIKSVQGRARESIEARRIGPDLGSHMLGMEDPKRPYVKQGSFREWEKGGPGDGGYKPDFTTSRGEKRTAGA